LEPISGPRKQQCIDDYRENSCTEPGADKKHHFREEALRNLALLPFAHFWTGKVTGFTYKERVEQ